MLLSGFPIYGYDWESDGIYYEIIGNDDSSCEVVRGDIPYFGEVIIPSNVTYNNKIYSVTSIGTGAFKDCFDLYSIGLPETLTTIRSDAFGNCGFLQAISIPDNVKTIDRNAFRDTYIEVLYIGKAINNVGTKAFTLVPEIHTTSSLEIIGDEDFEDAESLETLYVSESIQEIAKNAFVFCDALRNVHIESLANWCKIKFGNIEANPLNKTHGFYVNGTFQTSLTIPDGVTEISDYAFYNCWQLYDLNIPDSVILIGENAFYYCHQLSRIHLGKGIRSIGRTAFSSGYLRRENRDFIISDIAAFCQIDSDGGIFSLGDELYYNDKIVRKIDLKEQDDIDHIGANIFVCYEKLLSVSLPNTITTIGERAFCGCNNLTKVNLSDNIITIPNSCFRGCENLSSITLPSNIKYLEAGCFEDCSELESISFPLSMVEINDCFYGCSKLKQIYSYATDPFTAYFSNYIISQATLYVPHGCKEKYLESPYWNGFYNIVEMEDMGGIDDITLDSAKEISRYDLQGKPVGEDHRGITVIKYSDGSVEKKLSK